MIKLERSLIHIIKCRVDKSITALDRKMKFYSGYNYFFIAIIFVFTYFIETQIKILITYSHTYFKLCN